MLHLLLRLTRFTIVAFLLASSAVVFIPSRAAMAACTNPATTYGTDTVTYAIPTTGTYRLWSRIQAPDTVNNSFYLQVDGGCPVTVGDVAIAPNLLTWVDYQNGDSTSKINLTLTAGNHTFLLTGREPGVIVDRLVFSSTPSCLPTGTGDLCGAPPVTPTPTPTPTPTATQTPAKTATPVATPVPDRTPPSSPGNFSASLIIDTQIAVKWNASSDNVAVKGYRLYKSGVMVSDQTSTSYVFTGLTQLTNYSFAVEAYDTSGNISTPQVVLNVKTLATPAPPPSGTTQPPGSGTPITITPPGTTDPVPIPVNAQPVVGGTITLNAPTAPQTTTTTTNGTTKTTATPASIKVDGATISSNGSLDTTYLTNGKHTVSVTQDGVTASRTIEVNNKLNFLQTLRNQLFAGYHGNAKLVNSSMLGIALALLGVTGWFVIARIRRRV
jgi:hypothetical protein